MPIRVMCGCGQTMSVPDSMAGKSGKCPKCKGILSIPRDVPAKGSASATSSKSNTAPDLSELLDQVGLQKRVGARCPDCDAPIPPQAALCFQCGFHFESGEKVAKHELTLAVNQFGNRDLNEAAESMAQEKKVADRLMSVGMPWWVVLCLIIAGFILAGAGVLIVDGRTSGMQPQGTPIGDLQRLPVPTFLLMVLMLISGLITIFAHWAIVFAGFGESLKQGLLCLFVPFYTAVYGIMRFKNLRGTVTSFWLTQALLFSPALCTSCIESLSFHSLNVMGARKLQIVFDLALTELAMMVYVDRYFRMHIWQA